ncbi:apolipoprotein N-acyltransferase [Angustibacter speluncae]
MPATPDGVLRDSPTVPLALSVPLAAAAGVLASTAFPGRSWWWAAPLSVALLAAAVRGRRGRAGYAHGLVHAVTFLAPLLHWTSLQVGALPWLALVAAESLLLGLLGLLLALTSRLRPVAWRVVAGAGALVAVEALQARVPFGGFGWSRLAFSQSTAPTLDLAALGGAPLVSAAVAAVGLLLLEAVPAGLGRRRPLAVAACAVAAAAVLLAGLVVPTPVGAEAGTLRAAGVQGNVPRLGLEFNAERRAVLDNHARGTRDLAERVASGESEQPDLVVWPENASDIDPFRNVDASRVIDEAVDEIGAPTLVGTLVRGEDGRTRNTTLVWQPEEGPVDDYVKRAPVPFAEYVPYRDFFRRITPLVDQAGDFAAGDEPGVLDVDLADGRSVRLGDLICFEVVDDDLIADVVDGGAQLLVVQTNNATFGLSDESVQQLAMSRLRAVESGRAVLHVSTVGVSAVVAPDGTLLERSALFEAAVLEAEVPLRTSTTLASRLGTWPEGVLAAAGILGALLGVRRRRREAAGATTRPGATTTNEGEETA